MGGASTSGLSVVANLVARRPSVNRERRRQREMGRDVGTRQKRHLLHGLAALEFPLHHCRRILSTRQSSSSLGSREGNQTLLLKLRRVEVLKSTEDWWFGGENSLPFHLFSSEALAIFTQTDPVFLVSGDWSRGRHVIGMGPVRFCPG